MRKLSCNWAFNVWCTNSVRNWSCMYSVNQLFCIALPNGSNKCVPLWCNMWLIFVGHHRSMNKEHKLNMYRVIHIIILFVCAILNILYNKLFTLIIYCYFYNVTYTSWWFMFLYQLSVTLASCNKNAIMHTTCECVKYILHRNAYFHFLVYLVAKYNIFIIYYVTNG